MDLGSDSATDGSDIDLTNEYWKLSHTVAVARYHDNYVAWSGLESAKQHFNQRGSKPPSLYIHTISILGGFRHSNVHLLRPQAR